MARGTIEVLLVDANGPEDFSNMDSNAVLTVRTQEKISSGASSVLRYPADLSVGSEPEWNETFLFNISEDVEELYIKLLDRDTGRHDDLVGEVSVPLGRVFAEESIPVQAYCVVKDKEYKGDLRVALNSLPRKFVRGGYDQEESYGCRKSSFNY